MNLTVTAEGVETANQKQFLRGAGCDEMQGYLFSRVLSRDQVASLLGRWPQGLPGPLAQLSPSGA
jgi:EAL domain-containing protein (putative c-di-GMP-specific phosphodiesterase class I)